LSAVDAGLSPPIVKPDTVIDRIVPVSDRMGAGNPGTAAARPTVLLEIRRPIRQMSIANPLWGAPRTHEGCRTKRIVASQWCRVRLHCATEV
jgi:hypothetical protein